jgi:hypothetical protein
LVSSWRFWRRQPAAHIPPPASYFGIYDHLSPATIERGMERLRRLALFSPDAYKRWHQEEVAGADPLQHAFSFGMFQQYRIFDQIELAKRLAQPLRFQDDLLPGASRASTGKPADASHAIQAAVYVSTRGNVFMREIAVDVVRDLNAAGLTAELRDEKSSIADRPSISIFMAPHEFFILGEGWDWVRDEVLESAIMLGTEQPQTEWFAKSLPLLLMSRGVIDLFDQTVDLLRDIPVPALHFVPGVMPYKPPLRDGDRDHSLFRVLPAEAKELPGAETPFVDRPIDIAFFGAASPRRDKFFSRHAAVLADYRNVIYLRRGGKGPLLESEGDGRLSRLASHVSGHAKITLNIHQSEFGYFEWHRMVRQGMAAGSLVISDNCLTHGDFKPGVHYLETELRHIPNLLDWLLKTPEGANEAERVRRNALQLLADEFSPAQAAAPLAAFLTGRPRP